MATATKAKPQSGADVESILEAVERIEKALPPSGEEVAARRSYLDGQLRCNQEHLATIRNDRRMSEHRRLAEIRRYEDGLANTKTERDNLASYSPAIRRDAALVLLAKRDELMAAKNEIEPRHTLLVNARLRNALSVDEFTEHERLSALMIRINKLLSIGSRTKSEIADLVPPTFAADRESLAVLARTLADIPGGKLAGQAADVAARVKRWASGEVARLDQAALTQPWDVLEGYEINPL